MLNLAAFVCHHIFFAFKAEKQESPLDHLVPFGFPSTSLYRVKLRSIGIIFFVPISSCELDAHMTVCPTLFRTHDSAAYYWGDFVVLKELYGLFTPI